MAEDQTRAGDHRAPSWCELVIDLLQLLVVVAVALSDLPGWAFLSAAVVAIWGAARLRRVVRRRASARRRS
jgi:Flp pilus assembly protein TadB